MVRLGLFTELVTKQRGASSQTQVTLRTIITALHSNTVSMYYLLYLESGEMNHVVTGTVCSMYHAAPRTPLHWEHVLRHDTGKSVQRIPTPADGHTLTQLRRGDDRTHAIIGVELNVSV